MSKAKIPLLNSGLAFIPPRDVGVFCQGKINKALSLNFARKRHKKTKQRRFIGLANCIFLLVLLTVIPVRLAIAFWQAPSPQAILTLGGGKEREEFTAQFARQHPNLEIWVSSGLSREQALEIFQAVGIPKTRIHIDCRAVDTVTNFTSLVADFKARNFQHLYIITADFHITRAKAIATFVFGSRGIAFTPVAISNQPLDPHHPSESWYRTLRDVIRAIVWIFSGRTGASLNPNPVEICT
jgi:uncharacterized SAM-binding protein YcdF (DUF218 family)